ncbi:MAG TPA: hypothetical protein VET86_05970 [Casimicrobiaceae bacterium]|nr:hypothetical protein [Casimicrobiaceae bacterium]
MNAGNANRGATRRVARRVAWLLSLLWLVSLAAAADMNLGSMFSDLWWNSPAKSEDGWGMTVDHQDQVMFVTIYTYRADTSSYWVVATLNHVPGSRYTFTGDLYEAHGPWFGGPFSATPFDPRKVGTATFTAAEPQHATLNYTVDGTPVNKTIERQTLRNLNFSGAYFGAIYFVTSNCANPIDNGEVISDSGPMTITHSGSSLNIVYSGTENTCTMTGSYAQSGGLGSAATAISCTGAFGPISGTFNLANMQWAIAGGTANVSGHLSLGCDFSGSIVGAVPSR